MKQSPDMAKLEAVMRSSKIVAGGFLGNDPRSLTEIIEQDAIEVQRLGLTLEQIADRMQELTQLGREGLGTAVKVSDALEVWVTDTRGSVVCPWPHPAKAAKTVTTARRIYNDKTVRWSDLSVHMIREHGFFEGRGAAFRLEPKELAAVIF